MFYAGLIVSAKDNRQFPHLSSSVFRVYRLPQGMTLDDIPLPEPRIQALQTIGLKAVKVFGPLSVYVRNPRSKHHALGSICGFGRLGGHGNDFMYVIRCWW